MISPGGEKLRERRITLSSGFIHGLVIRFTVRFRNGLWVMDRDRVRARVSGGFGPVAAVT